MILLQLINPTVLITVKENSSLWFAGIQQGFIVGLLWFLLLISIMQDTESLHPLSLLIQLVFTELDEN